MGSLKEQESFNISFKRSLQGVFAFENLSSLKKETGDDSLCENKEIAAMS